MSDCSYCKSKILTDEASCPLCGQPFTEQDLMREGRKNPYPKISLRYDRQKVFKNLMLLTIGISGLFLLIEVLWLHQLHGLQLATFGLLSLWTVVYIIISKRRNIAKSVTYLFVIFSLITIYLDYVTGWEGWSMTYAIPIISIFSILAMYLAVKIVHLEVGDYVMYLIISSILGLMPALFLVFKWVKDPALILISIGFSLLMFLVVLFFHGGDILHEWKKRMQI